MMPVVAVPDEHAVLGGRLAPLGCTVAFIDRRCQEVLSEIQALRTGHEIDVIGPLQFEAAVGRLDPMEAPWTTEVIADCGTWTAYLNNFVNGGDPSAIAPVSLAAWRRTVSPQRTYRSTDQGMPRPSW